jgi:hypothetical protein
MSRSTSRLSWPALAFALALAPYPACAQAKLDEAARTEVINRVLAALGKGYVFPDIAAAMERAVRAAEASGQYRLIADPAEFAAALMRDLQAVSHDRHLRVVYRGGARPQGNPAPNPVPQPVSHEKLEGNIGYLKILGFPPAERIGPQIDAAFKELSGTDALIIDLRQNGGGSPDGVMYMAGYMLPRRTLIARIYSRPENDTTEMWTHAVPGPLYLDKPVYVLTSRRTFSAAEAAAYHLKHLGRVLTVGDTTGGGAHRVTGENVGHGFSVAVPITRPINVVTGGDWEGSGVIPDLAVAAEQALIEAQLAALRKLPASDDRAALIRKLEQQRPK